VQSILLVNGKYSAHIIVLDLGSGMGI